MNAADEQVLGLFQRNRELISQRKARKSRSLQQVWEPSTGWLIPSERQLLEENDRLPDGYRTVDERKRGYRLTQAKFKEICDGSKIIG
jgi:hypothetical protein